MTLLFASALLVVACSPKAERRGSANPSQADIPTTAELNAGARSEYDLVGVSPISECGSPQVRAELEKEMRAVTKRPPGFSADDKWWDIQGFVTTGESFNGHHCHAFMIMGSGAGYKQTAPLDYVTRYEDARLTVVKTLGEWKQE